MLVTTEAVVLSTLKYGDTSKIAHIYSKEYGKISIIAKGVRTSKSKLSSFIEPLNYCSVSFYKKNSTNLHLLSQAEFVKNFPYLKNSYQNLFIGFSLLEAIAKTLEDSDANTDIFSLLIKSISLLNEPDVNPYSVFTSFNIHLSKKLGFMLDLKDFEINEKSNKLNVLFNIENGNVDRKEEKTSGGSISLNRQLIDKIIKLSKLEIEECAIVEINEDELMRIYELFIRYYSYHLDKTIKFCSLDFIQNK